MNTRTQTIVTFASLLGLLVPAAVGQERVTRGLVTLFDFTDGSDVVRDRSGTGFDLRISSPKSVQQESGSLRIKGKAKIQSAKPARKMIEILKRSRELTLELWVKPAKRDQSGPARILTLSKSPNERNFTLGQDGKRFDIRLRSTKTSPNGLPSVASLPGSLTTMRTHVVYTRDRNGKATIYLNGKRNAEGSVEGSFGNWDAGMSLAIGDEITGGRPWAGSLDLVAIYSRALSPKDVAANFRAGASATSDAPMIANVDPKAIEFERRVAPLLSKHCLECHDASSRKGGLVLSHKALATKGGESGTAFVAGHSSESLLWQSIESDDMPHDRQPLTEAEKAVVKKWIDDGATWSLDVIDPAVYVHSGGATQQFVRRLTVDEYIETVRVAVGVDIARDARELLPADLRADGFSNTAYNLKVDLKHVEAYAKLAGIITSRMDMPAFLKPFGKRRNFTDPVMRPLIGRVGKWLLRGPLDGTELNTLRGITTTVAAAGGTVDDALALVVEAMLQSPRFIYRIEEQPADGEQTYVNSYELASRISYALWGGPPDRELMKAAEEGDLDEEGVRQQVQRMLADPRAVSHSKRFVAEWLNLDRLKNLRPSPQRYPKWKSALANDMRAETLAFFEDVVWKQEKPLGELLNSQVTFVTPDLAKHYGLDASGDELSRVDLTSVPARGGLLTQGSVLTVGGDEGSTVTRGLFVMNELLRGVVNDPPPCVDTTPVPSEPGVTKRAIAMTRIKNANCGGCHMRFEPLSFGLEKYDGLGAFNEKDEHGNSLRSDGEILFPGESNARKYESAAQLMDLLAGSDRVRESITWKVTQWAVGRPLGAGDARTVTAIHAQATTNGGTYQALMMAIVASDLVQMTGSR